MNSPRSPPFDLDGQVEYADASFANRSSNVLWGPSNKRSFKEMAKDSSATKMCEAEALFPGRMKDPKDLKRETPMAATVTVKFLGRERKRESSQRESQLYIIQMCFGQRKGKTHIQ